jgi:hypothetical protein
LTDIFCLKGKSSSLDSNNEENSGREVFNKLNFALSCFIEDEGRIAEYFRLS